MIDMVPTDAEVKTATKGMSGRMESMLREVFAQPDRSLILIGYYHHRTIAAADARGLIYPVLGGEHRLTVLGEEVVRLLGTSTEGGTGE